MCQKLIHFLHATTMATLLLGVLGNVRAVEPLPADVQERFRDIPLFFQFQGKGSCLPYDGGVVKEAVRRIPALAENRVILGGNSSGAISSIYFSCYGFSPASLAYAEYRLKHGKLQNVQEAENTSLKMIKLLRRQPTEVPLDKAIAEFVAFALGVERWEDARTLDEIAGRSKAELRLPIVIAAANKEVVDNRVAGSEFEGYEYKVFDPHTYAVSWKPDVYDYYRGHPEQFRRDHPDLELGDSPYIGKACTLFVDRSMYELLRRIPNAERLADLRLMTTPADMLMAIKASVAEPTYFDPVPENNHNKLEVDDTLGSLGNTRRRVYCGGYILPVCAQDVRRMVPGVRVLGTGWTHLPKPARGILQSWYLIDLSPVADYSSWWVDLEITASADLQKQMAKHTLTSTQEFELGEQTARQYFDSGAGLPRFVRRPKFNYAAELAVWPTAGKDELVGEASAVDAAHRPLKTLRGLGPLLKP